MSALMARIFVLLGIVCVGLLRAAPALACGGGFGPELEVEPDQTVALSYRDGIETYVFQPAFCGGGAAFGLILPIPAALEEEPSVADEDLFEALEELTAPTTEIDEVCEPDDGSKGSRGLGGAQDAGASNDPGFGAEVLGGGRVDVFDWVLLEAESASDLTQWLDDNGFPYDAHSMQTFTSYVDEGFDFVAFKISEGARGGDDCGTFGPIQLRFASETPIVPLRMVTAHEDARSSLFRWRVFAFSDTARSLSVGGYDFAGTLVPRFSGSIGEAALARLPALGALAQPGDVLAELEVEFEGATLASDLELYEGTLADLRRVERVRRYKDCDGCSVTSARDGMSAWYAIAAALSLVARRRRRSR